MKGLLDRLASLTALALLLALAAGTWIASQRIMAGFADGSRATAQGEFDAYMDGFQTLRFGADGRLVSTLSGTRLEHFPIPVQVSALQQPQALSLRADGSRLRISAAHGRLEADGKRLVLEGDARLLREPGGPRAPLRVEGEHLIYWPDLGLAESETAVHIESGRTRLDGIGMRYENDTGRLELSRQTSTRILPGVSTP
jgi:lipopolysaccharide export system protein LptC